MLSVSTKSKNFSLSTVIAHRDHWLVRITLPDLVGPTQKIHRENAFFHMRDTDRVMVFHNAGFHLLFHS